ncbi:hypothetical protein U1Q18_028487 [Sarracenia purpurea var. burkii]
MSSISSSEWIIIGDTPTKSRVLATRSMETKLMVPRMSGDRHLTVVRWSRDGAQQRGTPGRPSTEGTLMSVIVLEGVLALSMGVLVLYAAVLRGEGDLSVVK